jgi:hypothetical protein
MRMVTLAKPLVLLTLPIETTTSCESKEGKKKGKRKERKSMSTVNKM